MLLVMSQTPILGNQGFVFTVFLLDVDCYSGHHFDWRKERKSWMKKQSFQFNVEEHTVFGGLSKMI